MNEIFGWRVHATASGGGEFITSKSQFGDGYAQEIPLGINNEKQKWSVTVSGSRAELMPVLNFIRERAGQSFLWTPPLGVEGYYKCKSYSPSDQGGAYFTLAMEFEQGHMPPSVAAPPGHLYWRLSISAAQTGNYVGASEIEMRAVAGGPTQCVGGIATADSQLGAGYEASKAFDGTKETAWANNGAGMPSWIQYQFATPTEVVELAISTASVHLSSEGNPKDFTLDWSDDGVSFTTALIVMNSVAWPAWYEFRTFTVGGAA